MLGDFQGEQKRSAPFFRLDRTENIKKRNTECCVERGDTETKLLGVSREVRCTILEDNTGAGTKKRRQRSTIISVYNIFTATEFG